ncbi:unnamed protein product [Trichogramma brassicae]|uniref:Uncharacterized protein n=1 Tax=Trichogramma brassicae TaxID=86971 RepID=A0A6H5HW43_9HYME|nr:unnamed protein product [Trichogramma brassicae]
MGARRVHCTKKSSKNEQVPQVTLNLKERRAVRLAEFMELKKQKKKTVKIQASDAEPPSIVTVESIREIFRNRVVCVTVESEENVQSDAVSKPAPSVSVKVETAVAISTPQLHTSEQAVMSSAGPSTTSTSDKLEVTASTSSSAAVGSLETDVASSSPTDTDELKKPELDQGETLMPWRLRPIKHYMTYIPMPKAKLKEWRDNLRKRDALSRHKRCSDTTVIDIFEDGFQISDEEYAKQKFPFFIRLDATDRTGDIVKIVKKQSELVHVRKPRGFTRKSSLIIDQSTRLSAEILVDSRSTHAAFRSNPRGYSIIHEVFCDHDRSAWNPYMIHVESLYDPRGLLILVDFHVDIHAIIFNWAINMRISIIILCKISYHDDLEHNTPRMKSEARTTLTRGRRMREPRLVGSRMTAPEARTTLTRRQLKRSTKTHGDSQGSAESENHTHKM